MSFGFFCWHDLYTADLDTSKRFYGELLGWSYKVNNDGGMPYWIINNGHCETGGMCTVPESPPVWQAYINVEDLDAVIAKANELDGAIVHGPHQADDVGTMALIKDPHGAMIWAIQLLNVMPAPGIPKASEFCWYSLLTPEMKPAMAFYNALFGWTLQTMDAGGGVTPPIIHNQGVPLAGIQVLEDGMGVPPHWSMAIATDDIEATMAKASELGATTVIPVMPMGTMGLFSSIQDPVGAHISFWQQLAPVE